MAEITSNSLSAMPNRLADKLEKPQLDDRTYRVIQLPNKLEVLLIHDAETDKASAAMDVNVGSFSDSDDLPGMAHAVEHLLFMGTEKYPGENDYNQYLQKYGGHSNAFTASTDTNYFFELSASSTSSSQAATNGTGPVDKAQAPLYGALDRFAQFFIKPLFLEDTLDRELKAVDSENKKNLQSDNWRLHQLNKSLANKKHPFNKFSTGNYKVLHDDPIARGVAIREAFIDFYRRHYSANRMKLAVLGREDLDTLEAWVTEFFSEVPNQDLEKLRWDDIPAYGEAELATQIFAKPVMEMRDLDIYFVYPDEEALWETHPGRYISHLIGHEGPGSLLAYLKTKGWVNGLSAGPFPICPGGALFGVHFQLTKDGMTEYKEVVKALFQYIAMVKEQPPQEWIVEEMKQLAEVDFRFRQKIPASRTTSSLVGIMQKSYPRDKLLSAPSLIWKFDPENIQNGLDHLTPGNFRLTLAAQEFPGGWDQKEKWYGTEYKYEKMPQEFMDDIKRAYGQSKSERPTELHLPAKNEFIPANLEVEKKIVDKPTITPKLVRNDARVRTWWKKDDQYWAPKANVNVILRSPVVQTSAMTTVMTHMFKALVEDSLNEYAYDAELAGLDYSIQDHSQGLDVSVSGYNDKLHVLLERVLISMRDLEVKNERFEIIKERVVRGIRNFDYQQPYQQIQAFSKHLILDKGYMLSQLLDELLTVTADDVRQYIPQILSQLHIEILAHGNLYREDALRLTDVVESTLHGRTLPSSQWPIRRSLLVPQGSNYVHKRTLKDPANVNHCIDYVLFTNLNTDRATRAKLLLFAQAAEEPVFDTLRSKEQLGYVVSSSPIQHATVSGWRILIQSERTPKYLEQRIDVFLTKFGDKIRDMKQEDFDSLKIALINKRLEKLKNLNQETARFWGHITNEVFDFELVYRDVEQVEKITKGDLIAFFDTFISPASEKRARVAVHLLAQTSPAELAAKTDPAEKTAKVSEVLDQLLTQLSITSDRTQLQKRVADVPSGDLNAASISSALSSHLTEDVKTPAADVESLMSQVGTVLEQALPQLGIKAGSTKDETAPPEVELPKSIPATLIEDIRLFKAGLEVTKGAVPVRDIKELEDREAKL